MVTMQQATRTAETVFDRLVAQGRSTVESRLDAIRWVEGNYGITVNLPTVVESITDVASVLHGQGWTVTVCYVGCTCDRCRAEDERKAERETKAKQPTSGEKAAATKRQKVERLEDRAVRMWHCAEREGSHVAWLDAENAARDCAEYLEKLGWHKAARKYRVWVADAFERIQNVYR